MKCICVSVSYATQSCWVRDLSSLSYLGPQSPLATWCLVLSLKHVVSVHIVHGPFFWASLTLCHSRANYLLLSPNKLRLSGTCSKMGRGSMGTHPPSSVVSWTLSLPVHLIHLSTWFFWHSVSLYIWYSDTLVLGRPSSPVATSCLWNSIQCIQPVVTYLCVPDVLVIGPPGSWSPKA